MSRFTLPNSLGQFRFVRTALALALIAVCGGAARANTDAIFAYTMDQAPVAGTGAITDSTADSSGTLQNTTTLPTQSAGKFGTAWTFGPASTSYIQVGENAYTDSIGDTSKTTGVTISFWLNVASANAGGNMRACGSNGSFDTYVSGSGSSAVLNFRFGNGTTVPTFQGSVGNVFNGVWHHVCATVDFTTATGNVKVYADGVLKSTSSVSITAPFTTTGAGFTIGARSNGGYAWGGALDDWALFTQPLTAAQVQTLYTQGASAFVNQAPVITLSQSAQTLSYAQTLVVSGSVTDDGIPNPPGMVTSSWSLVSGPGTVTFSDPSSPSTNVRFSGPGTYDLRLTASDSDRSATSDIMVSVVANIAPTVTAYALPRSVILPSNTLTLYGSAIDDGLPNPPGILTITWSTYSGPAQATFANPSSATTTASFPAAGRYVLRLSASDGQYTRYADVGVRVYPATVGIPTGKILVDPGSSRAVWMSHPSVALQGSYLNTSNPVTVAWSLVQGPGSVTLGSASSLATTATFSAPGQYILQLAVTDSAGGSGSARTYIAVYPTSTNYGYTDQELQANFTQDLGLEYDFNNFNWAEFSAPPAPYVHPRIQFGPADLPDIRNRLANTLTGQYFMGRIRSQVAEITSATGQYNSIYNDLAGGNYSTFYALGPGSYAYSTVSADITFECFRCLIDNDTAAAPKAAAAFTGLMQGAYANISAKMPTTDYRNVVKDLICYNYTGYAYDFIYNFMTPTQQATCRQTLSLATTNMWTEGLDAVPAGKANTSNWVPTHTMHLLIDSLAIEGETGYDPNLYPRLVASLQRYMTFGVHKDGTPFEGLGKGLIASEALMAMARRGDYLLAAEASKQHIRNYYAYSMVPWGGLWTWDENIGGEDQAKFDDVAALKHAYPADPIIDFMFRNDETESLSTRFSDFNRRFWPKGMDFLHRAIFAEDYDHTQTWAQEDASTLGTLPLTLFSQAQGLMIARSDWTSNALQLHMQPRSIQGGHSHHDRNGIIFSALGFNWAPFWGVSLDTEQFHSVVLIDNVGASVYPALPVEYDSTTNYDFLAGDASVPFNYGPATSATPAALTWDWSQSNPYELPWTTLPYSSLPTWQYAVKSNETWAPYNPVQYAYRTAGIVRCANPYALVVDDIQKDATTHNYIWNMQLNTTVTVTINGNDVILTDPSSTRRCLVRLLSCKGTPAISTLQVTNSTGTGPNPVPMLQISTNTVAPAFRVLLYPYYQGTALPTTTVSGNTYTISTTSGQVDQITLTPGADSRSRLSLQRTSTPPAPGRLLATSP